MQRSSRDWYILQYRYRNTKIGTVMQSVNFAMLITKVMEKSMQVSTVYKWQTYRKSILNYYYYSTLTRTTLGRKYARYCIWTHNKQKRDAAIISIFVQWSNLKDTLARYSFTHKAHYRKRHLELIGRPSCLYTSTTPTNPLHPSYCNAWNVTNDACSTLQYTLPTDDIHLSIRDISNGMLWHRGLLTQIPTKLWLHQPEDWANKRSTRGILVRPDNCTTFTDTQQFQLFQFSTLHGRHPSMQE